MHAILILTEPGDFHAYAVAEALECWGVQPVFWFGADFPVRQQASVWNRSGGVNLEICGSGIEIRDRTFRVVWNRRPTLPMLPEDLHPADREPASRDCQHFMWSLWHLIAPSAVWVNPLAPVHSATLKPLQLKWAEEVGLEIPPSLCSNDPRRIREFLRTHRAGGTIYKAFYQGSWKTEEGMAAVFTRLITEEDLPEDEMVHVSPGIFQARVAKDHELRVTFFGEHSVAALIRSQESPHSMVDWRRGSSGLTVEPADLPPELIRKCRALMARFDLSFATFDLIVTPEGRPVFLEMNPAGQFLFVERLCPRISILDPFCRFLSNLAGLAPPTDAKIASLAEVWQAAEERMLAAVAEHQPRPTSVVDETETLESIRNAGHSDRQEKGGDS